MLSGTPLWSFVEVGEGKFAGIPMMTLEDCVGQYRDAIIHTYQDLQRHKRIDKESLAKLLTTRDAIKKMLTSGELENSQTASKEIIVEINYWDERLKENLQVLRKNSSHLHELDRWFEDWRGMVEPPAEAWWWFQAPSDSRNGFLRSLSLICFGLSSALLLDFLPKFFSSGTGALGWATVIINSFLSVSNVGILARSSGQNRIEKVLKRLRSLKNTKQPLSDRDRLSFSLFVLCVVIIFSVIMPLYWWPNWYIKQGEKHQQQNQFHIAEAKYEQALKFTSDTFWQPNYNANRIPEIHLKLGDIDRDLGEFSQALEHYKIASQSPDLSAQASVKLAYVYLHLEEKKYSAADAWLWKALHKGDLNITDERERRNSYDTLNALVRHHINKGQYAEAWRWLDLGTNETDPSDDLGREQKYFFLTGAGETYLREEEYKKAAEELEQAIALQPEKGLAYCLKAETLRQQEQALFRDKGILSPQEKEEMAADIEGALQECADKSDHTKPQEYLYRQKARDLLKKR